ARERRHTMSKPLPAGRAVGRVGERGLVGGLGGEDVVWLMYMLMAGLAVGRATTAWGQWLVLVRIWLPVTGRLPWPVHTFLTDAYHRGVLRQTGAVYQFRHARLQDHLTPDQPTGSPRTPGPVRLVRGLLPPPPASRYRRARRNLPARP